MLSKKEILELAPTEEVVEVAGGKVKMHGLSAKDYGEYERSLMTQLPDGSFKPKPIEGSFRAKLVALCLTDPDGETFSEQEVAGLDSKVVSKLYDVARKLCGVSDRDEREMTAVFAPAQQDGSFSE